MADAGNDKNTETDAPQRPSGHRAQRRAFDVPLFAGRLVFAISLGLVLGIVPVSALQTFPDDSDDRTPQTASVQDDAPDAVDGSSTAGTVREEAGAGDDGAPTQETPSDAGQAEEGADGGAGAPGAATAADPDPAQASDPDPAAGPGEDQQPDSQTQTLGGSVSIKSAPRVGETLTASVSGLPEGVTPSYTYRWYKGSALVSTATGNQLRLTKADHGKVFHVVVAASAPDYAETEFVSNTTAAVKYVAPTGKVSIKGTRYRVGKKLTAKVSKLSVGAKVKKISWYATEKSSAAKDGAAVKRGGSAFTGTSYTPKSADKAGGGQVAGRYLYAVATLSNGDGETRKVSSAVTKSAIARLPVAGDVVKEVKAHYASAGSSASASAAASTSSASAGSSSYTPPAPAGTNASARNAAGQMEFGTDNHASVVLDDGGSSSDPGASGGAGVVVDEQPAFPWWWLAVAIAVVAGVVTVCMVVLTRALVKARRS